MATHHTTLVIARHTWQSRSATEEVVRRGDPGSWWQLRRKRKHESAEEF
jgi:hypothetical protein